MTRTRPFGTLDDGTPVHAYRLGDEAALSAEILDLGGILAKLEFPGAHGRTRLVLGLDDAQAYRDDPAYLGILVGRFGNRIADAAFVLDGRRHRVSANDGGNHLHGGLRGFGRRLWTVDAHDDGALARDRRGRRSAGAPKQHRNTAWISTRWYSSAAASAATRTSPFPKR